MQNNNLPRSISWSELPLELLRSIAKSLKKNPNDLRNFRAVCKNWQRSTSISVLLPFCDYSTLSYNLFTSSVLLLRPPSGLSGSSSGSQFDTPWMVSVVEITKGNIQYCHPFSQTPHSNLLKNFDVTQFHPSVLSESYHIASSSDISLSSAIAGVDKVVVFSTRPIPRINDCLLLVLHNGRLGGYPSFEAEDDKPEWVDVSYRGVDDFDDIVTFKGVIYAVDWEGKLYQLFNHKVAVQKTLVSAAVSDAGAYKGWRKRLVGSMLDQKLYLFVRYQKDMLKVFKLSKHGKIWNWVIIQSFEDKNQVLFMSSVYGFFVPARYFSDCQLRNCIVFSDNAFPIYSFRGWVSGVDVKVEEEIMVFQLGTRDDQNTFRPISSYPSFPVKLWSPPSWVLQPQISSPLQLHSDQR
ncbi:F-box protein At2g26160-like [Chenopodium quinoa]|nr:F-box protein At2g26160-like [Chenopodium quinoa]